MLEESEQVAPATDGQIASTSSQQPNTTPPPIFTSKLPTPPNINLKGDLRENWKQWRQIWDAYALVTGLNQQSNEFQVATFITCIGQEALKAHNGLPFKTDDEKKDITKILELWGEYCNGKANIIYERYKFNNRRQKADERIDAYATVLRDLASSCNYGVLNEEMIRDRIVCGITNSAVRKKLLQIPDLTYDKCMDVCRAAEATETQMSAMQTTESTGLPNDDINVVGANSRKKPSGNESARTGGQPATECRYCGRQHNRGRNNCPAFGKSCSKCGKMNHFAAKCLSSRKSLINNLQVNESEASDEDIIDMVSLHEEEGDIMHVTQSKDTGKILATMKIGRKPVKMLVNSGASCNVIPAKYVPAKTTIIPSNNTLVMYSKSSMPAIGTTQLNIQNPKNSKRHLVKFVVVNGDYTPLLGLQTAQEMELLTIQHDNILNLVAESNQPNNSTPPPCPSNLEEVMTIFGDIFDGTLGHMRGDVHLEIDENAKPTVMPPRRVPIAIKPKVKQELERLTAREAITPVQEPTDWVSNMITTIKPDGSIRLCIDPHYLNQELKRSHYPLPVIDDILPDLSKVKVFSKADLQERFLQVSLDVASSRLTTFQTPWGRYRWLRMPFGISPAPEVFQMKLHQNLEGLPGIFTIADDILITGQGDTVQEAEEDHDRNLANFLSHCREQNIKLKKEKFKYKCVEVQFMGHCLTNEGLEPDPQKVDAILKMEKPQDVTGVQRVIRLVKYMSKFLNSLSQICKLIRRLTRKDVQWRWSTE